MQKLFMRPTMSRKTPEMTPPAPPKAAARFRSGAVARMVRMPVSTLRIWERRYGLTAAMPTDAGHRQYIAADVQRVALLRQLTGLGHAIGSIVALDMAQLRAVAATHATTIAARHAGAAESGGRRSKAAPRRLGMASSGPRRYDDAALADLARLSTTIACECPRHVAELLLQLTHFETYSAECESLGPTDAALHAYLHRIAGSARALFESALEAVAVHEGLMVPARAPGGVRARARRASTSP